MQELRTNETSRLQSINLVKNSRAKKYPEEACRKPTEDQCRCWWRRRGCPSSGDKRMLWPPLHSWSVHRIQPPHSLPEMGQQSVCIRIWLSRVHDTWTTFISDKTNKKWVNSNGSGTKISGDDRLKWKHTGKRFAELQTKIGRKGQQDLRDAWMQAGDSHVWLPELINKMLFDILDHFKLNRWYKIKPTSGSKLKHSRSFSCVLSSYNKKRQILCEYKRKKTIQNEVTNEEKKLHLPKSSTKKNLHYDLIMIT